VRRMAVDVQVINTRNVHEHMTRAPAQSSTTRRAGCPWSGVVDRDGGGGEGGGHVGAEMNPEGPTRALPTICRSGFAEAHPQALILAGVAVNLCAQHGHVKVVLPSPPSISKVPGRT
jgi:hypothetical protein